jgi:hypothetical protein
LPKIWNRPKLRENVGLRPSLSVLMTAILGNRVRVMILSAGTRLGPYEIPGMIGARETYFHHHNAASQLWGSRPVNLRKEAICFTA